MSRNTNREGGASAPLDPVPAMIANFREIAARMEAWAYRDTAEDKAVLIKNSELFYAALKKAGVEGCKLYTEEKGPHGIGLGQKLKEPSKWPAELEAWMKERGLLAKK